LGVFFRQGLLGQPFCANAPIDSPVFVLKKATAKVVLAKVLLKARLHLA
jgi:hypothetical protein